MMMTMIWRVDEGSVFGKDGMRQGISIHIDSLIERIEILGGWGE